MKILSSYDVGILPTKKKNIMSFTMNEKRAIYKETSLTALFILEYYLTVITRKNFVITDTKTAIATGLPIRTVQVKRRSLENKNLYYVDKITAKGTKWIRYCVRKEGVYCNKYFDNLFSCNTVSDVYRSYTRKQFVDILVNNNMNLMETKDITDLLDHHHDKLSKKGKARSEWSSLVIAN